MFRPARAMIFLLIILALLINAVPSLQAQSTALYFPATGHHLTNTHGFLSFWEEHNGARLLGFPVTEAFTVDEQVVQYFERGRLEHLVDPQTGATSVQTGRVGAEYAEALWRSFTPVKRKKRDGVLLFENDFSLRAPFLEFWQAGGGEPFFGPPISEAIWETTPQGQRQVQYFERSRLERDTTQIGTPDEIVVSDIGRSLALLRGINTAPVANWGAATFGPPASLAPDIASLDAPPSTPVPPPPTAVPPAAPVVSTPVAQPAPRPAPQPVGNKVIIINLTRQWLYAYEGDILAFDAPVATGRDGMNTPTGTYSVYAKLKSQTMRGVDNGVPWVVPDVPDVMYFNGGVAMHGAYWHNLFGSGARPSHGCVNLPLHSATWLYNWAPIGTTVRVTY